MKRNRFLLCSSLSLITSLGAGPEAPCEPDQWSGHWRGQLLDRGYAYPLQIDIASTADGLRATIDLPDYVIYHWPLETEVNGCAATFNPAVHEGSLTVELQKNRLVGKARILRRDAQLLMQRAAERPVVLTETPVNFESKDARLAGTLVKPPGPGPFPALVLTHGSGPNTRHLLHYHGRAHLFARSGIATLIYDKRGAGDSTGERHWDLDNLTADALAGVRVLRARPDIDGTRIGVAGFSQGGWVAPMAATADESVAFVLVGSTPGVPGGEQNIVVLRNRLTAGGYDDSAVEQADAAIRALYELYQTGQGRDRVITAFEAAEDEPWFQEADFRRMLFMPGGKIPDGKHPSWRPFYPDIVEVWSRVDVPVLSMWGALDDNIPVDLSRQRIQDALIQGGNVDFELAVFPDASHGFWLEGESARPDDWPRQVPGSHEMMVAWLRRVVGADDQ